MSEKLIDGEWWIPLRFASLYVDVTCYKCKKLMALPNAKVHDGRYYCEAHKPFFSGDWWFLKRKTGEPNDKL